jgi:LysW-gamma-L-lysine carboxypeptidase
MMVDAVALLEGLVRIASVSGDEEKAVHFLVQKMEALGLEGHVDEVGNAVGIRSCPDEQGEVQRDIVLLGHIDTVPGDVAVRMEKGRLYGRGTVDAKGPLAAFVVAAARCQPRPGTRLVVIGAVEEEAATSRGAYHVAASYRPAACIIGEPSGWNSVTLGYKGRLLLDYCLEQPMGHSAGPEEGVAQRAVRWWNRLLAETEAYNRTRQRLFDQLLPSLRQFNTSSDGLTNHVSVQVGVRLPPQFDSGPFVQSVVDWAGEAQVRAYGEEEAFAVGRANALVRAFNHALRQRGERPRYLLKTGTSDMNVVGPRWECPIVAYGPGDSRLDHTPEEHIVVEEYLAAIGVLEVVLGEI